MRVRGNGKEKEYPSVGIKGKIVFFYYQLMDIQDGEQCCFCVFLDDF